MPEGLAGFGDPPGLLRDPSVDGGGFGLFAAEGEEIEKLLHRGGGEHAIGVLTGGSDLRDLFVPLIPDLAHDLLQNILHGDDAGGLTVFVYQNDHVVMLALHLLEERVQIHGLRHDHRLVEHLLQGKARAAPLQKIISGMEDADDPVFSGIINGDAGKGLGLDQGDDLLFRSVLRQIYHGFPGRHHILRGHAIQLEDILDISNVVPVQRALVAAGVQHQDNVLLRNRLILFLGIDAHQPQDRVGGDGEEPDDGLQNGGQYGDEAADGVGQLFLVLHGDALGDQLAEDQGKIREDQRHRHHGHGVHRSGVLGRDAEDADQKGGDRLGKIVRRKGGAQKAGQRDADLDGGEELGRRLDDAEHFLCPLITVRSQSANLLFVQGNHGDLRGGKERVA